MSRENSGEGRGKTGQVTLVCPLRIWEEVCSPRSNGGRKKIGMKEGRRDILKDILQEENCSSLSFGQ